MRERLNELLNTMDTGKRLDFLFGNFGKSGNLYDFEVERALKLLGEKEATAYQKWRLKLLGIEKTGFVSSEMAKKLIRQGVENDKNRV